jgi:hypothetical protein
MIGKGYFSTTTGAGMKFFIRKMFLVNLMGNFLFIFVLMHSYFYCYRTMAERDGETDVEAVYRQERLKELGKTTDGHEQPPGPPDGIPPPDDESAHAKARRFLAKHKRSTSSTSSNSSSVSLPIVNNNACSNSVYDTIHSLKLKTLDAPSLYGGASSVSKDIGSFKLNGEAAIGAPFEKKSVWAKKSLLLALIPKH